MKQAKKRVFRKNPKWTEEQIRQIWDWAEQMIKKVVYPPFAD